MKYIKLFEYAFRKGKGNINLNEIYILFDTNEGHTLNKEVAEQQKVQLLDMFKKHFEIDEDTEEYAMTNHAWAWIVRSYTMSRESSLSISIVTTNGWSISEKSTVIEAEELIRIGLENLDTYLDAKKYNL